MKIEASWTGRKKHRFRLVFRVFSFLFLFTSAAIYNVCSSNSLNVQQVTLQSLKTSKRDKVSRNLLPKKTFATKGDEGDCDAGPKLNNKLLLIPYAAGVLYMFVAIAIVCDEFFVPSLEEIASERYLNLSMDVAGATLMAAGGSAPELFTSLIGTFQESEVGFGTIVGSAVFNVLFVIGMCAIFSKEILHLTAWPLARDCVYYTISLILLAIFCGYSSPGKIELWEAIIQFSFYFGYVLVMKFNTQIYHWMKSTFMKSKVSDSGKKQRKLSDFQSSRFRAGLLNLLVRNGSLLDKVGMNMVSKMSGDVETVFTKFDTNGDGFVDKNEFHKLFESLDCEVNEEEVSYALSQLDEDSDEKIDLKGFTKWFLKSETRLLKELKSTFDEFDADNSGAIDEDELLQLLHVLGVDTTEVDINAIFNETCGDEGGNHEITYANFEQWFRTSRHWSERKERANVCADETFDPISDNLKPPKKGTFFHYVRWIILFPIVLVLCLTIPDVRQPGRNKLCFISFILSISWIGGFTYLMVSWAEIVGNTLGIPMVLMGLTFLAAGTSVPDLISSVIVARMGEGDMAVSSSIGSNIFDITVGLPFPWLIYCLWESKPNFVEIGTDGMTISIIILIVMLICIVTIIHFSGWKMTKKLGASMFILYFFYLIQAVIRELPFKVCD